ncbi:hypothetical protein N7481_003400 [Penicillium waksmanii]|uniref:uncharacterized protein n=1 Tax=Penicillium waksmanii TaxID=69791 RepID=UPI0025498C22|nr:uncharacterized protein N7481_003400 [Penicillium waksmanii]KAJ5988190.1 hypothetical protein N7481_003400 [Penicillium waksmanii]
MDLAAPIMVAARATSSLIATSQTSYSDPTPSPSDGHKLFYHGASASDSGSSGGENQGECHLLGPFSLLVQLALGGLALLSLVFKRWRERPQRPVKVWAFDVSKQVFGSAMLHLLNLTMSMFSAGQIEIRPSYTPNPCSFYLLNLGIDTTLGIPILILILRVLNILASYTPLANPPESIESGNYGQPPKAFWWFKQSIIYFIGLLGMKVCVFFLIQLFPFIVKVGDWALRWTEGNTALQIIFVMLLFPVTMNAIQYYIIDIFIKKSISQDGYNSDLTTEGSTTDSVGREALLAGIDDAYSSDTDVEDEAPQKSSIAKSVTNTTATATSLQESEGRFLDSEDHNPAPPYQPEPPNSSGSGSQNGRKEVSGPNAPSQH